MDRIAFLILGHRYSPYAVLKTLDKDEAWPQGLRICEKTLYNWIEAGDLPRKRNTGKGGKRKHSDAEFAARSIERRPKEILRRLVAGHWEGDTAYSTGNGPRECLLTLVERKARMELITRMPDRSAESVKEAFDKLERRLGSRLFRLMFLSVTFDNGSEFSDVPGLEKSVLTKGDRTIVYFAHPYCFCERGTNENHNGIIRRFLPKGTDFAFIKAKEVKGIQDWMNSYPRRILNGSTPLQSFKEAFALMDHNIKMLEAC